MPSTVLCINGAAHVPLLILEESLCTLAVSVIMWSEGSRGDTFPVMTNGQLSASSHSSIGICTRGRRAGRDLRGEIRTPRGQWGVPTPFVVLSVREQSERSVFPDRLKTMRNTTLPLGRLSTAICNYWRPYSRVRGYCSSPATVWDGAAAAAEWPGTLAPGPRPRRGRGGQICRINRVNGDLVLISASHILKGVFDW